MSKTSRDFTILKIVQPRPQPPEREPVTVQTGPPLEAKKTKTKPATTSKKRTSARNAKQRKKATAGRSSVPNASGVALRTMRKPRPARENRPIRASKSRAFGAGTARTLKRKTGKISRQKPASARGIKLPQSKQSHKTIVIS